MMQKRRRNWALSSVLVATSFVAVATPNASPVSAAAPGDLRVNEIMYHPEDDDPAGEFLELYNATDAAIDLAGWCIDGVDHCFTGRQVIGARSLLVTTSASWSGRLSNGGEDIALIDPAGTVIEAFEYDDKNEWPANTDGNGASLQRRSLSSAADDPGNWAGRTPTPGRANLFPGTPYLIVDDVEHTASPSAGQTIAVTATSEGATSATLEYRIGFGPVRSVAATVSDGRLAATIPGQAAGELVRYRWIVAGAGRVGKFPRQGDGMTFTGTVVDSPSSGNLPRFQWFMEDAVYEAARNDLTKRGDDGYPAVFVYDGQVFDATTVRVKGQTSRFWPKKKWKFVLPDGHDVEIEGFTDDDVDEFALHSGWSDKSFAREVLSAELLDEVGLPVSQAFPVRLERNGDFFGAYTYVEQRDGTFRDRQDFEDATVYEVGGNSTNADMRPSHADLPESNFRELYDKDTNEFENDDELRDLIRLLAQPSLAARADLISERIDASTVINSIAASMVIQHQDWGLKNYDLRLTDQEMWAIAPTDFDLTWGRRFASTCGGTCDPVFVGGAFEHPGTPLFAAFWSNTYYRAKITQRVRTIADENFDPTRWAARATEIQNLIGTDGVSDRAVWGTYGRSQNHFDATDDLIDRFIRPQHARLTGSLVQQGRVSPFSQPSNPRVAITDVRYQGSDANPAHVIVRNFDSVPVDISGFEIEELDFVATGGTILNPGESAIAVHEDAASVRGRLNGRLFMGLLGDEPADAAAGFALTDRRGRMLSARTQVGPRQMTTIEGRAGQSAVLNLVATETAGAGFLQVVDCDLEPGSTSNLNVDGEGQTRAGAAVAAFDAEGELCVYNATATHIVVDLTGYFDAGAIDDVADERLLDTRLDERTIAGGASVVIEGRPNSSALLNLVSVGAVGAGFLQVLPCDVAPGTSSNLNYDRSGQTRSGLAVGRFDASGRLCLHSSTRTHAVVDLQAYLADESIDDVADRRLIDTRDSGTKARADSIVKFSGQPNSSAFVSLTLTEADAVGYAQLVPCSGPTETSSNINIDRPGQTIANLAIAEFDENGEACLLVVMRTHVVIDLQAYLADAAFDDVTDTRLIDTRR